MYWQAALAVFLVFGGQQPTKYLLHNAPHHGVISKEMFTGAITSNKNLRMATGSDRNLTPTSRKKEALLLKPYPADDYKSSSEKKSGRKHFPFEALSALLMDKHQKELTKKAWNTQRFAKNPKLTMKRDVTSQTDRKYRKHAIEHCGDLSSYYFPSLNECYRIYQTPRNNLIANYNGIRNELAYGTTQYDYAFNCWELYRGKLLDIGEAATAEKMKLVKQMVLHFYRITGQRGAIRVGFMINKNYELMAQNGTFYDILDGVYVKMHPTEPCKSVCCIIIRFTEANRVEFEQASCGAVDVPNFFCQKQGKARRNYNRRMDK